MSFRRIVVGFDGSPEALAALAIARQLAAPDAAIVVAGIAVLPTSAAMAGVVGDLSFVRTDAERSLLAARAALADHADAEFVTPTALGVAAGLHELAAETGADLVVVGASRHHGIGEVLLGSDAEATLHGAPCAVLVGPAGDPPVVGRIGVAFDGLPAGRRALRAAGALAVDVHGSLEVLAVLDTTHPYAMYGTAGGYGDPRPDARDLLSSEVAEVRGVLTVDPRLESGDPAREILELGREVDLLVLGSRKHGTVLRILLGSVSSKVVRRASCAVLVVPDSDAVPGTSPPVFA
ncbi:universal stress protein [Patulibacter sp.]|uniref:universal stress protein n=1 Tax=Patulibacter sp. TaxID=1912859 RepID=UPI0027287A0C|nr:universal stress protein [Patulibacter sp.]MDO9410893.1 universal stress protein [Patulibacter sp.]